MANYTTQILDRIGGIPRSGTIVEEVDISERYLLEDVDKRKNSFGDMLSLLNECNVIWRFTGYIDDVTKDELMLESSVSGSIERNNLINTSVFEAILNHGDRIGVNKPESNDTALPLLGK